MFSSQGLNSIELQTLDIFKSIKEHQDLSFISFGSSPEPKKKKSHSLQKVGLPESDKNDDSMTHRLNSLESQSKPKTLKSCSIATGQIRQNITLSPVISNESSVSNSHPESEQLLSNLEIVFSQSEDELSETFKQNKTETQVLSQQSPFFDLPEEIKIECVAPPAVLKQAEIQLTQSRSRDQAKLPLGKQGAIILTQQIVNRESTEYRAKTQAKPFSLTIKSSFDGNFRTEAIKTQSNASIRRIFPESEMYKTTKSFESRIQAISESLDDQKTPTQRRKSSQNSSLQRFIAQKQNKNKLLLSTRSVFKKITPEVSKNLRI